MACINQGLVELIKKVHEHVGYPHSGEARALKTFKTMNYLKFLGRPLECVGEQSSSIEFLMDANTLKNVGLQFITPDNPVYFAPFVTCASVESKTLDTPCFPNAEGIFQNEFDTQLQPGNYTLGNITTSVKIDIDKYNSLFPTDLRVKNKVVRVVIQFGVSNRGTNPYF